jgi:uncharacterized LabA/DUF88 family protein
MNRTSFLVDGFNLYHSVKDAARALGTGRGTKWLDLRSLCSSYLGIVGGTATLQGIFYFSALATHLEPRDPNVTARHRTYIKCLEDSGVVVELSRFKKKEVTCPTCQARTIRHEEKETDVAISAKLIELLVQNQCESVVLITGDTDLAPAIRTARRIFPAAKVRFAFPYRRQSSELASLAPGSFGIRKEQYTKHQFPDPFVLTDGTRIPKPPSW